MEFPDPTLPVPSRAEVFLTYLDYFRSVLLDKVGGLSEAAARTALLPSGWAPIELANHLTHVERRWLEWGFEDPALPEPWADQRDGRWYVDPERSVSDVLAALRAQGHRTREIVEGHDMDDAGRPGPRWAGAPPATLERTLFHLLQEYARHAGHLDVVVELAGGPTGE